MTTNRAFTRRLITGIAATAVALPISVAAAGTASAADLPADTAAMLQHMVAEEKLARDVYTVLGAKFDAPTFDNIAKAEARHQSSVRTLLSRYGITDPTVGDAAGVFDDDALQALYTKLVSSGSTSVTAAAEAGITIERVDIADLDKALAANPPADVARVLGNLRRGSESHLAAFTALKADPNATCLQDGTGTNARQGQGQGASQGARQGQGQGQGRGRNR